MQSTEIQGILNYIAHTTSTKTKLDVLRDFSEVDEFKAILNLAYNPLIRFNVKSYEKYMSGRAVEFSDATYDLLNKLSTRELSGNAARKAVSNEWSILESDSRVLFENILNKDLRAGINKELINKACPGLIPDLPYMRCSLPDRPFEELFDYSKGIVCQIKADGMFCAIYYNSDDNIELLTRQSQSFDSSKFEHILEELRNTGLEGCRLDGELRIKRDDKILSRTEGNGILNSVLKGGDFAKNEVPFYTAWDCVAIDIIAMYRASLVPYTKRFDRLLNNIEYDNNGPLSIITTHVAYSAEDALEFFKAARQGGEEGTIEKDPDNIWKDHKSATQFKRKPEYDCELRVIALNAGKGKNENLFGSLYCVSECGDLTTSVSGITDELRKEIFNNWRTKDSLEDKIITVRFKELVSDKKTGSLSLFEPRFVEIRLDKVTANTLDEIKEIAR